MCQLATCTAACSGCPEDVAGRHTFGIALAVRDRPVLELHRPGSHALHRQLGRSALDIRVGPLVEQEVHEILMAVDHRHQQRRRAVGSRFLDVRSRRQQRADGGHIAAPHRKQREASRRCWSARGYRPGDRSAPARPARAPRQPPTSAPSVRSRFPSRRSSRRRSAAVSPRQRFRCAPRASAASLRHARRGSDRLRPSITDR